ncbi:Long chain acyl-CoA synthetase 6, peroxisomal [Stylophora pistillata]|uniref:long-chain-fatty-acid--CoA ligase n=1 Tax=Stylophora pistillata TaxID=50429 RepID=A0A2B4R8H1_STYPI|nr:Long chain acyl-CoA synthetase 6, peroxisomal [Stylophora pistillata]
MRIGENLVPAKPEDVLTVCYTSETTGLPKGTILTHANLFADISAYISLDDASVYDTHGAEECIYIINHANLSTIVCNEDKVSSLLENAHLCKELKTLLKIGSSVNQGQDQKAKDMAIELVSITDLKLNLFVSGGRIGYYSGDVKQLFEGCKELK